MAYHSASQGADWEKNIPGKLFSASPCKIPGFRINEVFNVVNDIPSIAKPKGFNVKEWFVTTSKGSVYTANLYINFYEYYSFDKGPVQLQDSHPSTISIYINDPERLMNPQSILFLQETRQLKLPVLFTDTFIRSKISMNNSEVFYAVNMEYNSRLPMYILHSQSIFFFKPATKEQYMQVWIKKLSTDIDEANKQIEENKQNLMEMEKNPALYTSLPEIKKAQEAFLKWANFLKEKKQYYEKQLAEMTVEEKKGPAYYAMYKDMAVMMDRDGKYVENISGHLLYEPAEGGDALFTTPVFTFIKDPFNSRLPKSAIQLLIIEDPYGEGETDDLKKFFDKEFFPVLDFEQLYNLMNK